MEYTYSLTLYILARHMSDLLFSSHDLIRHLASEDDLIYM